jgi:hypothetical protein
MKKNYLSVLFLFLSALISAQQVSTNYDESKIPLYNLPDPLVFNDGSQIINKREWPRRRTEIINMFENEVYGKYPEWKGKITAKEMSINHNALGGDAVSKEIKLTLRNGDKSLDINVLLFLPHSLKPVPVFLGYNFGGNHAVSNETNIAIASSWMQNNESTGISNNKASETGRGKEASRWQVDEIISRGYGLVTVYYGDVDPDFDDGFRNGVHSLYDQQTTSTSWGSIAAWAWGLSRVMDWLETDPSIDAKRVVVIGHSRLGKTALWAGATDERFAIVISNDSGCGGAALSKRIFGETVNTINTAFPHWFCNNFNKYNYKEELLPVDQHELIAIIAPRPVYVASAEDDKWADPKGEFLSCVNASPVYVLLGYKGFPAIEMPSVNSPVTGGTIGYHIRTGIHDVTLYDWQQYLDFADIHLKSK